MWLLMVSCGNMTNYSPYDANISRRNLNPGNIELIQAVDLSVADSIVFVAISDPHADYSDLRETVDFINEMEEVSFVVVCGDLTNLGLDKEFEDYYSCIRRLNKPFITIIGNHDYLSNGKLIYNKMFGPTNFYFDIGTYRMVIFDNIVWENGNQSPDFGWLQTTLEVPDGMTSVVCSHIHPWDPQLGNGIGDSLMAVQEKNPVCLSIFGHGHGNRAEVHNGLQYLMIPNVGMKNPVRICLKNNAATYQILTF